MLGLLSLAAAVSLRAEEQKITVVAATNQNLAATSAAVFVTVAGPQPAPIKVKLPGPLGNPKLSGLKRFASQAELDAAFGAGEAKPERAVDFAKEDLVCVGWLAGVPAGQLKWQADAPGGLKFYVEERPSRVRGNVMMIRADWFTVPKGTPVTFGRRAP